RPRLYSSCRCPSSPVSPSALGPRRVSPFFLLSQTPPPPPSTLFPYTTLFRSRPAETRPTSSTTCESSGASGTSAYATRRTHPRQDRKSTRLNSSHVSISYAVFCLKKKKQLS